MRNLVWGFAGRTYHIVGNCISWGSFYQCFRLENGLTTFLKIADLYMLWWVLFWCKDPKKRLKVNMKYVQTCADFIFCQFPTQITFCSEDRSSYYLTSRRFAPMTSIKICYHITKGNYLHRFVQRVRKAIETKLITSPTSRRKVLQQIADISLYTKHSNSVLNVSLSLHSI